MSMMVNRVSNVAFRANENPLPEDFLSRPGAYAKPMQETPAQQPKKKHTALKVIVGLIVAAAAIAGGLYAAHKWAPETFNAAKNFTEFKDLKNFEKAKAYVTTAIGKAGKYVEDKALAFGTECTNLWNRMFNRTTAREAADATETITEAIAEAPATVV